ncbi:MAG: putative protein YqeY [Phycisphaerae bacterium]|nr:putative protein YqeY [Phycisphaerae bacterium]
MAGAIKPEIQRQMKEALKARESERLGVLRMILAEINNAQLHAADADEAEAVAAYHKRLVKARPDFERAADVARLAALDREIAIVAEFLPAQLSDAELEGLIEQVVAGHNFTQRDFGKAMKEVMSQVSGQADGGRVSQILKAKLAGR